MVVIVVWSSYTGNDSGNYSDSDSYSDSGCCDVGGCSDSGNYRDSGGYSDSGCCFHANLPRLFLYLTKRAHAAQECSRLSCHAAAENSTDASHQRRHAAQDATDACHQRRHAAQAVAMLLKTAGASMAAPARPQTGATACRHGFPSAGTHAWPQSHASANSRPPF